MQLFPVDRKSPQCFRKKDLLKTNKLVQDFNWWTPPSSPASTDGGQDTKKSLTEPRAELLPRPQRWSNKPFTKKKIFKNFRFCPKASSAGGRWRKSPLDGAMDLQSKI